MTKPYQPQISNLEDLKLFSEQIMERLKDSPYLKEKEFIKETFKKTREQTFYNIKLRLLVIDSLFSTNMSKRYFGIDDLANAIHDTEQALIQKGSYEQLEELFKQSYGFNRELNGLKATSLLSKYIHFVRSGNFPIYDSLIKKAYRQINKEEKITPNLDDTNFYYALKSLNEISGINNFELLDMTLWYSQKLTQGSFSLIYSKEDLKNKLATTSHTSLLQETPDDERFKQSK